VAVPVDIFNVTLEQVMPLNTLALKESGVSHSTVTVSSPVQFSKALIPIVVTLAGIVTDVKLLQPEKAENSIFVTLLGIVTEFKPVQLRKV